MQPIAFITGINGQDGSYLSELLLSRGYQVHGLVRKHGRESMERIEHLVEDVVLHEGDLQDGRQLTRLVGLIRPTEIYNLAADTFVPASWEHPIESADATAIGVVRLLEAVRHAAPAARFLQASTSEMFGNVSDSPQDESTAFCPRNPYAASKLYGHWMTVNYRQQYGMFAASAIMFNHESPRRGPDFVSRKITRTAAEIKLGLANELRLGNLQAQRDWGYAGDHVEGIWRMLQHDVPDDFVIGTGHARTVQSFVEVAFAYLDLDWREYVRIDPRFYRPAEPNVLVANPTKARRELGWTAETSFETLVQRMVDADRASVADRVRPEVTRRIAV